MKEFKAGDFTSGKMGEIFKDCFFKDIAIINHKQFGRAYMIPECKVKEAVLLALHLAPKFAEYEIYCTSDVKGKDTAQRKFAELDNDVQIHMIEDFFEDEFENWFEILTVIA
jgi:hypothetical protein